MLVAAPHRLRATVPAALTPVPGAAGQRTYTSEVFERYCLAIAEALALIRGRIGGRAFAVTQVIDEVLDLHEHHAKFLLIGRFDLVTDVPQEMERRAVDMRTILDSLGQASKLLDMLPLVIGMLAKSSREANLDVMRQIFDESWEGRLAATMRRMTRGKARKRIEDFLWRTWYDRAMRKAERTQWQTSPGALHARVGELGARPALLEQRGEAVATRAPAASRALVVPAAPAARRQEVIDDVLLAAG
jgi:hypothetical protein